MVPNQDMNKHREPGCTAVTPNKKYYKVGNSFINVMHINRHWQDPSWCSFIGNLWHEDEGWDADIEYWEQRHTISTRGIIPQGNRPGPHTGQPRSPGDTSDWDGTGRHNDEEGQEEVHGGGGAGVPQVTPPRLGR
ncbi:uncharacterized protein B0T15DRAFT_578120 [Chaetomium strumarium]|uniref:Uncharacterized protein n=1 Tax=Chaetomium strumarium TaxID=1170767 RepID=A0AAJ0GL14_9PEZI|nr:hypothetical protein B0T15DRAFT_578120 [Chaetomium strumarium]